MMWKISADMPPSSNVSHRNPGHRVLVDAQVRKYKTKFPHEIRRRCGLAVLSCPELNQNGKYALSARFYFDRIRDKDGELRRLDLSRRIEILEDCIKDLLQIDDRTNFIILLFKDEDPNDPRVEVTLQECTDEQTAKLLRVAGLGT